MLRGRNNQLQSDLKYNKQSYNDAEIQNAENK